jgi:phage FluMu gp28-like protein
MSRRRILIDHILPRELPSLLKEGTRLGLGLDIATTEKKKSNPSALALTEQVGSDFFVRMLLRWKTSNDLVTTGILQNLLFLLAPRRPRRLCIDATSERFFAASIKREFAAMVPVDLVVSSESTEYLGEKMTFKQYLGNLLVNTLEDGHLFLPDEPWVRNDFRQVQRVKGSFHAEPDEAGNHADGFDAVKLSLHGLITSGGPAEASATQVGSFGKSNHSAQTRSRNPLARLFRKKGNSVNV